MRKYNSHLEDVWGIYTELQNSLSEQYAPEELLESANRLIEIAKGKIAKQKTKGLRVNEFSTSRVDTYTMMTNQPKRETIRAISDFCDFVDEDDHAINFAANKAKFSLYGVGA